MKRVNNSKSGEGQLISGTVSTMRYPNGETDFDPEAVLEAYVNSDAPYKWSMIRRAELAAACHWALQMIKGKGKRKK